MKCFSVIQSKICLKQRGSSLIELMVSLTTGLLLITGVVQVLFSNLVAYSSVNSQSHIAQNGRVSLELVSQFFYQAGYWDDMAIQKYFANGAGFSNDAFVVGQNDDAIDAAVVDGTDLISVRFNGAKDGEIALCNGDSLFDTQAAVQRIYVRPALNTEQLPALFCDVTTYDFEKTTGVMSNPTATDSVILIDGVQNLQILYGVGADDQLQTVTASAVTDWSTVKSVTVGLQVSAAETVKGPPRITPYQILDKTVNPIPNGPMMKVFTQTLTLRNSSRGG